MTVNPPLLEVEHLRKAFALPRKSLQVLRPPDRLVAVDDVSVVLHEKRTLAIVGESGSGKTTVARCIVHLIEPDTGRIRFRGVDLVADSADAQKDLRRRIQMVFQNPYSSLNPRLPIGRAITEPAVVHKLWPRDQRESMAGELLDSVGLSPKIANRRPGALSGGQRQRAAIARALAAQPDVVIADEAVSALDVSIQAQILNLFMDLQDRLGLGIIFITHQLSLVKRFADDVAVMYLGRIVEQGPVATVFSAPSHPYTVALLEAQPGPHRRLADAPALKGDAVLSSAFDGGCRFRGRCAFAYELCHSTDPVPVEVASGHFASCHLASRATLPAASTTGDAPPLAASSSET